MNSNRIFPNRVVDKLDSKRRLNQINWADVNAQIQKLRTAQTMGVAEPDLGLDDVNIDDNLGLGDSDALGDSKLSVDPLDKNKPLVNDPLVNNGIDDLDGGLDMDADDELLTASNYDPKKIFAGGKKAAAKPAKKTAQKAAPKEKAPAKPVKNDKTAAVAPVVETRRVVAFTKPEQLSAEAIEAALASGDKQLANTILAARHQRRLAIASKIEEIQSNMMSKDAFANERVAAQVKVDRMAQADSIVEANNDIDETLHENTSGFKSVSDLNDSEKDAFSKLAARQGFPEEYVKFMIGGGNDPSPEVEHIIELVKTEGLSKEAKVNAVRGMMKTASLTSKDLNYLKNYWTNMLNYDDPGAKEFVDALFTNKYDKKEDSSEKE